MRVLSLVAALRYSGKETGQPLLYYHHRVVRFSSRVWEILGNPGRSKSQQFATNPRHGCSTRARIGVVSAWDALLCVWGRGFAGGDCYSELP